MGKKPTVNIASGNDTVPVQAGKVTGRPAKKDPAKPAKTAKGGGATNVVSGNARVGMQSDRVNGSISITF
ncbi:hypothetical protein [Actinoplanes friuliensis]|uniref:Uncharacterized protein n=1 Tax=Actinoplanes friuliensis DSM 7358 TaxID=1246995 RepID=U5VRN1_9ACTN|nr:hypothetical protein [Actinoplanes friuliensis]AGZ39603.1 hypothetical protein AFR_06570 [Actinoplanes friuliensis DSM 7358]